MTCVTCSNTAQAATPLIIVVCVIALVGGVAAYNYKAIMKYYMEYKEQLFCLMNEATIVVSPEYVFVSGVA